MSSFIAADSRQIQWVANGTAFLEKVGHTLEIMGACAPLCFDLNNTLHSTVLSSAKSLIAFAAVLASLRRFLCSRLLNILLLMAPSFMPGYSRASPGLADGSPVQTLRGMDERRGSKLVCGDSWRVRNSWNKRACRSGSHSFSLSKTATAYAGSCYLRRRSPP